MICTYLVNGTDMDQERARKKTERFQECDSVCSHQPPIAAGSRGRYQEDVPSRAGRGAHLGPTARGARTLCPGGGAGPHGDWTPPLITACRNARSDRPLSPVPVQPVDVEGHWDERDSVW